ncbi:uncharacterized protein LOC135818845 [Sycon ciliatum]|uniref:uncharacterized protein LOC135818845 n=1 Tax=Sycon ciliatum TaxID=27933 RepID=UPI0031F70A3A
MSRGNLCMSVPMLPSLVLLAFAAVSCLLPTECQGSTFYCRGFNVSITSQPIEFRAAREACKEQQIDVLRMRDHRRLLRSACYTDQLSGLQKQGIRHVWVKEKHNSMRVIDIGTNDTIVETNQTTHAFICAKDWNECKFTDAPCPEGTECVNSKGSYKCIRYECPEMRVENGNLLATFVDLSATATCDEGHHSTRKVQCTANGWERTEGLCSDHLRCPKTSIANGVIPAGPAGRTVLPTCDDGYTPRGYLACNALLGWSLTTPDFNNPYGIEQQCRKLNQCLVTNAYFNVQAVGSNSRSSTYTDHLETCLSVGRRLPKASEVPCLKSVLRQLLNKSPQAGYRNAFLLEERTAYVLNMTDAGAIRASSLSPMQKNEVVPGAVYAVCMQVCKKTTTDSGQATE